MNIFQYNTEDKENIPLVETRVREIFCCNRKYIIEYFPRFVNKKEKTKE